ncbi:MAG: hypothetical protein AB7T08_16205 [Hyphomonadaceae bacterium]
MPRQRSIGALSRRKLLGVAVAAPAAAAATRNMRDAVDSIVDAVAAWMRGRDALEALYAEWRGAENALVAKVRSRGLTLANARAGGAPEARRMRALDRRITKALRVLDRQAALIARRPARTPAGAIAKIAMGLRIQGPADWADSFVYPLIADGVAHLTRAERARAS